jgi:hypothetical protein
MCLSQYGMSSIADHAGSVSIEAMQACAVALSGQRIQAKTTVSSTCAFTTIGKDVTLPSGTSPPQHSRVSRAPCFSNSAQAFRALAM